MNLFVADVATTPACGFPTSMSTFAEWSVEDFPASIDLEDGTMHSSLPLSKLSTSRAATAILFFTSSGRRSLWSAIMLMSASASKPKRKGITFSLPFLFMEAPLCALLGKCPGDRTMAFVRKTLVSSGCLKRRATTKIRTRMRKSNSSGLFVALRTVADGAINHAKILKELSRSYFRLGIVALMVYTIVRGHGWPIESLAENILQLSQF